MARTLESVQEQLDASPFIAWLGLRVTEFTEQRVVLETVSSPQWANSPDGTAVHGGIFDALLDTAADFALMAALGHVGPTLSLSVQYLRGVGIGEELRVEGRATKLGSTVLFADARLWNGAGKLAALAHGTFLGPRD